MNTQKTLSILKPDAVKANVTGLINALIEGASLRIVAQKRLHLTQEQAERFYYVHHERPFFKDLVRYMSSGPVVVQVLEAPDAVADYRKLMGATNPEQAEKNTIRALYGRSIEENAVHGSDSLENAAGEIAFFFSQCEICG